MFAEHVNHCLRRCPAFDWAGACLFSSVQLDDVSTSDPPTWWPHDHGPTNIGAMVKKTRAETAPTMALQSVIFCLFQPIPAIWSYLIFV